MSIGIDLGSSAAKMATGAGVRSMRGLVDPELSARMGTTAPVVRHVGNALSLCSPHESYVLALSRVLGETPNPEDVTVVVPDWWSPRAQHMVTRTLAAQYPGTARLVGAAPAAVRAISSTRPFVDPVVAVLDLGAACTSATVVVDHDADEPQVAGEPMVLHGRGGDRLDALLLHHVFETMAAGGWSGDRLDPDILPAARTFHTDIRAAREQFSTRPVVRLTPQVPGLESELRLVRAEFEDVARPVIGEIVAMLTACIAASGVDVTAVMLVGGCAPTPLLTQMISVEVGLPVLLDDEPASAAARGAMRFDVDHSGRNKRSRRGAERKSGRAGRRPPTRPVLGARIITVPPRVTAALVPDESPIPVEAHPPTQVAPVETPAALSPPADDPVPEPVMVPSVAEVPLPPVAQLPAAAITHAPMVSRHAAPLADRPRPGEQVGGLGYRGRRRADAAPANESGPPESVGVEPSASPEPADDREPR